MYSDYELRQLPLSLDFQRRRVEHFLDTCGLRLDPVDTYLGIFSADDRLVGGGGLEEGVIKCMAVSPEVRGEGLMARLVSRLQSLAAEQGHPTTMVYTKPEHLPLFRDLGYVLLAAAPHAVLMESGIQRLQRYLGSLRSLRVDCGRLGVIVMNANPFTFGHQRLVEWAAAQVERLVVMVVSEERSDFPYGERMVMVEAGTSHLSNVCVVPTGPYAVSAATFPSYFLKQTSDAATTQMQLDADLFRRHIAPALGADVRFVGSEPDDALTRQYNATLVRHLAACGNDAEHQHTVEVVETPRFEALGTPISASLARRGAWQMVPPTSLPYVLAHYACCALRDELDLTPKPGLVDCHDNGAHADMDHALMLRSIRALRPWFWQIAGLAHSSCRMAPSHALVPHLQRLGMKAERAMLEATGGVNTHRGALFSLGLAVAAAAILCDTSAEGATISPESLQDTIRTLARSFPEAHGTHGAEVRRRYPGVKTAIESAREGFPVAFEAKGEGMACLLSIIAIIDDTNVLFRCGADVAREVRQTAARLLDEGFTDADLQRLNADWTSRGISPGGAADMYALNRFVRMVTL